MSASPWIIEPTEESFPTDVLERSTTTPVVVDFWAPWCGPCRQLTPVMEKLADEFAGQFILAKVNTDAHPGLAAAFQVQSIPFVAAVRDQQIVDLFQGALPEAAVREWLGRLLPSEADQLSRQAAEVESQDPALAETRYRAALAADPQHVAAKIGLARVLVALNNLDAAAAVIAELEQRGYLEPEAEKVRSQLHVRQAAAESGGLDELRRQVAEQPDDLALQVQFAEALAAAGDTRQALETCLAIIPRDRSGVGQQAKTAMLDILNTLDDADLASEYRRRLASVLY